MKPRHRISRAAIELIKRFEGYRARAAKLADGRWTIGYGHTQTARQGAEVSEQDAEALLLYDLIAVAHLVNEITYAPLTQNQFDALCCFAFNIGLDNFRRSSVLRRINEGQLLQAACAMELWRKADFEGERIVIDALVRRRAAEKTLFLTPMDGWVPAPSPILRPNIDADIAGVVPRQTPVALRAALDGVDAVAERDPAATPFAPAPPEEEAVVPSPAQAAAAAVSYRLASIFSDEPVKSEAEPDTEAEAEAEAKIETDAAPALVTVITPPTAAETVDSTQDDLAAPPAPAGLTPTPQTLGAQESPRAMLPPGWGGTVGLIGGGAERAFVLTPLDEAFDIPPAVRPIQAANDPLEAPPAPPEAPRVEEAPPRILIDDTLEEPSTLAFEPDQPRADRGGLGALLTLACAGLALFAGGLFWAFNARVADGGLLSPLIVGWIAGIAGVGFFGVAAYLVLQRLGGGDDPDDLDDGRN